MKYKYNKDNLVYTLNQLANWAKNLDEKDDKEIIADFWNELDNSMDHIQSNYDDVFGTEGYEVTMMGRD